MKRKTITAVLLIAMIYCVPFISQAQPPDPPDPPDGPDPAGAPFDPSFYLLIASGAGYIANKGYYKRKKAELKDPEKLTL